MSRARWESILGLPVPPTGLRRKPFQKVAILLEVKVFGDAIHPFEREGVAAEIGVGPLGRHQDRVRARPVRVPFGLEDAGRVRIGGQVERGVRASRPRDVRLGEGVRGGREILVADLGRDFDVAFVKQRLVRDRGDHAARRIRNQPAQQLLPEGVVRMVFQGQSHLPAPRPARGQDGRAPAAVVLGDEQRHLPSAGVHFNQYRGAGLGCAGILVVFEVGEFLPARLVARRVFQSIGK